jgi:flagellar biosynthesis protein
MAVALTYSAHQNAPTVVAKGRGIIAQAIIERAKQHGIFVHESTDLVALLMQIELEQEIPAQLYLAVAELLGWLYQMEHQATGTVLSSVPA